MTTNDYAGNARLERLRGSDFEVADGQPDIRGWDVKDAAGKKIGDVKDLIFDVESLKVRYMVVDLDDNDFDLDDRKVLIPIGLGELHEKGDDVILSNVTTAQLAALPEYRNTITNEDEYAVRNVFTGAAVVNNVTPDADFYSHEHYNMENIYRRRNAPVTDEDIATTTAPVMDATNAATPVADNTARPTVADTNTYSDRDRDRDRVRDSDNITGATIPVIEENVQIGKRQVQTGGAYIKSRVVEQPIEEEVKLREEHIRVERNPVDRPASSTDFDTFKEGVIEITEHSEVPVVNKEARVVEEITVSKDVAERTEMVRDTVRKTEVDIEHMDNDADTTETYRNRDRRDV